MFSLSPLPQTSLPHTSLPVAMQARNAVHELRAPEGTAAHLGFAVLLLAALAPDVPVLWASPSPLWYPPGLAWLGFDPARCLFARAANDAACLGTLETALRGGMAGVGQCQSLSRLAAKRLALAAKQGGNIGLLLRHAPARTSEDSTAFTTRWLITPATQGRLRAELLYAKGGIPGVYLFTTKEAENAENAAKAHAFTALRQTG